MQSFRLPKCQPGGCTHRTSGKFEMNLLCPAKILSPSPLSSVKTTLQAHLIPKCVFPMEKKTHLEMLSWLWERIHVQERIQKGGHKCALWIWARQKEEGSRLSPFLCSCPMLCKDWKSVFPITTERSRKVATVPKLRGWQRSQQNRKKKISFYFHKQF